jgi:hypothetical protein
VGSPEVGVGVGGVVVDVVDVASVSSLDGPGVVSSPLQAGTSKAERGRNTEPKVRTDARFMSTPIGFGIRRKRQLAPQVTLRLELYPNRDVIGDARVVT